MPFVYGDRNIEMTKGKFRKSLDKSRFINLQYHILYIINMKISTRRLLTSNLRKIGGFFAFKKIFKKF